MGQHILEHWPTIVLLSVFAAKLPAWPPHYEDEPWVWTPAMNARLGIETEFPSFQYSYPFPAVNWAFEQILRLSPFGFWFTARGLALFCLGIICAAGGYHFRKTLGFKSSVLFQAVMLALPLSDALLFTRLEVFALAPATVAVALGAHNSQRFAVVRALFFALAVSIHPLSLVLSPFLIVGPPSSIRQAKNRQWSEISQFLFVFMPTLLIALITINIAVLVNWTEFIEVLNRNGQSSNLFTETDWRSQLTTPLQIFLKFSSQLDLRELLRYPRISEVVDTSTLQKSNTVITLLTLSLSVCGLALLFRRSWRWAIAFIAAVLLHSFLVSRDERYYLVILVPMFAAVLASVGSRFLMKPLLHWSAVGLCALKILTLNVAPEIFSPVVATQFALNAESPLDYSESLANAIPPNSVVIGSMILRSVLEDRPDVFVYGMTALTQKDGVFGQTMGNCKEVKDRMIDIFSSHQDFNRLLVLFGTWQSDAFRQYSDEFQDSDFECVIQDVESQTTISGVSSNGTEWSWVVRDYGRD